MRPASHKKPERKSATIWVEWGYEQHSITLTPRNWAAVKSGRSHSQRGKGYRYEGEFFWDYWSFEGGLDGKLEVYYGDDAAGGFLGKLRDADITEHAYKGQR